jgi:putative DNA primase/helicase
MTSTKRTSSVVTVKKICCAIYTRKSSEEGLQQEFNTLDAQRESAEKYIASQEHGDGTHGGWVCLPDRYDDGGFAGAFGLQQLIGKSVAIVSDARFAGDNISTVTERLLCISGEDALSIDRKFLGSVTMKLPTRFMLLTNELPRMTDASGALAGRLLILRLTRSFYGKEDVFLTEKLTEELPGILLWAIEGLMRLRRQGRFTEPRSAADAMAEMEDLTSPVIAFVRDCCDVKVGSRVSVSDLYKMWKRWCEDEGRSVVSNRQVFGRDLMAAVPSVITRRNNGTGRFYEGIRIKAEVEAAGSPF